MSPASNGGTIMADKNLHVKNGKYYVVFSYKGKTKWVSTGIEAKKGNKKKAIAKRDEILAHYRKLKENKDDKLLTDYLEEWLNDMKNVLKPSTWETYDKTVHGKLIPYFAPKDIYLKELTPRIFTEYFKHLKTEGRADGGELGAKSVKNIRGVLSAALEDARINKLIDSNPVTDSRLPTFEKDIKKKVPTYTPQQVRQLLDYAKQVESHIYIFLVLVLFTGARKGELLALTWDDVDFEHYRLNINKSRTGTRSSVTKLVTKPKTEGSTREIPLAKEVVIALTEEKAKQEEYERMMGNCAPKNNYIVRTINGTPYSNLSAINRVVNRLTDNAGLPHCTIHGFRHTVASILDDNGVSLQEISVLLGHENVSTTEKIYIHRNRKAKAEDIDLLEHVINQAGETADAS